MPPTQYVPISLTRAQAHALAKVGRDLAPQIHNLWPDQRKRSAIINVFDRLEDLIDGDALVDPFDVDIEMFGEIFPMVRSHEFATTIRARMRDLIAVTVLWRALEDLGSEAGGLLEVPNIDSVEWRAEVLDLLIDRGVEVELPGETR